MNETKIKRKSGEIGRNKIKKGRSRKILKNPRIGGLEDQLLEEIEDGCKIKNSIKGSKMYPRTMVSGS